MNRKITIVMGIVLLVFSIVQLGFAVTYRDATVVETTGMVTILKAGGEKAITPTVGMKLEHGDRIITGKGASISLEIDEDKYIKVGEKTYMSLSELMVDAENGTSTNIKLFTGQVWASLSKPLENAESFEIETPTAVMGAKGTKFMVKYAIAEKDQDGNYEGTTELVVLEGTVSMKTEVPRLDEGDTGSGQGPGSEQATQQNQEVEILVRQNETIKVNTRLLNRVAEEIQRVINAGTSVENINIQQIVEKSANVEGISALNLDLFVLEIIDEDPEEYDDTLTQDLENLIEKKKNEAIQTDEDENPTGIEIQYDTPKTDPTSLPEQEKKKKSPTDIGLEKINTLDVDQNGFIDHIAFVFNTNVNDESYNALFAPIFMTGEPLDVEVDSLADMSQTGITDIKNDRIVYMAVHEGQEVNTGISGTVYIEEPGMIKAMNGTILSTLERPLDDMVAPVLMEIKSDLNGDAMDKTLSFVFSEPIEIESPMAFLDYFVFENELSNVMNPLCDSATLSNATVTLKGLNHEFVRRLMIQNPVIIATDDFVIQDYLANERSLSEEVLPVTTVNPDMKVAILEDITVTHMTTDDMFIYHEDDSTPSYEEVQTTTGDTVMYTLYENTSSYETVQTTTASQYKITLAFSDFLAPESITHFVVNIKNYMTLDSQEAFVDATDIVIENSMADKITMTFTLSYTMDSPITGDLITIDLSELTDITGYDVVTSEGKRLAYLQYSGSTFEQVLQPQVTSYMHLIAAKTRDVNADGYVDHLELTFDEAVDDSSFNQSASFSIESSDLGTVDSSGIATTTVESFGDIADDATVFLRINEDFSSYNTASTGLLKIYSEGLLTSDTGHLLEAYGEGYPIDDGAPPQVVSVSVDLSSDAKSDGMKVTFSEVVDNMDVLSFFNNVRIGDVDSLDYSEAIGLDTTAMIAESDSTHFKLTNATRAFNTFFMANDPAYLYVNSGISLEDQLGNHMPYDNKVILFSKILQDETATVVSDVMLSQASSSFTLTLTFDDYWDQNTMTSYLSMGMYNVVIDVASGYGNVDAITSDDAARKMVFYLTLNAEGYSLGDTLEIDLNGLLDLKGNQVTRTFVQTPKEIITFEYNGSEFIEVDNPTNYDLEVVSAAILDEYDINNASAGHDGFIDYLEVEFNMPVADSTYNSVYGTFQSNESYVMLSDTNVKTGMIGDIVDTPNDNIIYLPLTNNSDGIPDTYLTGEMLYVSDGFIEAVSGAMVTTTQMVTVKDKAKPVLMEVGLAVGYDSNAIGESPENYMSISVSEPLVPANDTIISGDEYGLGEGTVAEALFKLLRVRTNFEISTLTYEDALSIDLTEALFSDEVDKVGGFSYEMYNLTYDAMTKLTAFGYQEIIFPEDMAIYDASGLALLNTPDGTFFEEVTFPVENTDLEYFNVSGTDRVFSVNMVFDNYLSQTSADLLKEATTASLLTTNFMGSGDESIANLVVTVSNVTDGQAAITLEIALVPEYTPVMGDELTIDFSGLTDIYGTPIYFDGDSQYQKKTIVFTGSEFIDILDWLV